MTPLPNFIFRLPSNYFNEARLQAKDADGRSEAPEDVAGFLVLGATCQPGHAISYSSQRWYSHGWEICNELSYFSPQLFDTLLRRPHKHWTSLSSLAGCRFIGHENRVWADFSRSLKYWNQRAGNIHFPENPAEMAVRMTLAVGDKVIYPGRGPCLIGSVVQKVVCGRSARFYRLALLDDSRAELFVPVDSLRGLQMRALLDRSEIPKLLGHLKTRADVTKDLGIAKNWRQRELDNSKLFKSGSIFDLADMVESLTQLSGTKNLASHERETLHRARKLLICEISEVMDESKSAAEARIDKVLEAAKNSEAPVLKRKIKGRMYSQRT